MAVAPLRIATRGSALALWQAGWVAQHLPMPCELVVVETRGDQRRDVPLELVGGQGLFVKEVQQAVLDGRADAAVHSAKDLPSAQLQGLVLAAVPERGDPRDGLVGMSLDRLPVGGVVATGSVRRRAQLAWIRPDLNFVGVRGNIGTRLERVPPGGALVVAAAALQRLARDGEAAELLDPEVMLPQVGQGALAVECRADDEVVLECLGAVDHRATHRAVSAERAWLNALGGGCDTPVGALARPLDAEGDNLELEVLVASRDGHLLLRRRRRGDDPATLGEELAEEVLDGCGVRGVLGPLPVGPATGP